MKINSNFFITLFVGILFFVIGVLVQKLVLNKYFADLEKNKKKLTDSIVERKFTNPLLDCKSDFYFINPNLEKVITEKTDFYKKNKSATQISVYFNQLNNGISYGINEKDVFSTAGLNKTPLLIAAFKLTEELPEVLKLKFSFDEPSGTFKKIDTTEAKDDNQTDLTLYDVMKHMIKDSSGETTSFLNEFLNDQSPKIVDRVFLDLGIKQSHNKDVHEITAKDYASFFSILYSSTYINDHNSEMALNFLTETEFKDGLANALDISVAVSHNYAQTSDGKLLQLHDCGIIYFPGSNYFLGIIVKGYDLNKMTTVIKEISGAVYQEVKTQVPNTL